MFVSKCGFLLTFQEDLEANICFLSICFCQYVGIIKKPMFVSCKCFFIFLFFNMSGRFVKPMFVSCGFLLTCRENVKLTVCFLWFFVDMSGRFRSQCLFPMVFCGHIKKIPKPMIVSYGKTMFTCRNDL